jgi:hypothetical protein
VATAVVIIALMGGVFMVFSAKGISPGERWSYEPLGSGQMEGNGHRQLSGLLREERLLLGGRSGPTSVHQVRYRHGAQ